MLVLSAAIAIGLSVRQESLDCDLIAAIKHKQSQRAIALLISGADANTRDATTPRRTFVQIVQDLLHGRLLVPHAGSSPSALALAVGVNDTAVVRALLQHHTTDVNDSCKVAYKYGNTDRLLLVLAAIHNGNDAIVSQLFDHGITARPTPLALTTAFDPLMEGDRVDAPLHWRKRQEGVRRMVRLLVDRGADVQSRDSEKGETALDKAAGYQDEELVEYLLAKGVSPNQGTGRYGALNYAVQDGDLRLARTLLHHGALIEHPNHEALIIDARRGATVRFLVAHGANINTRSRYRKYVGFTRLISAVSWRDEDTAEIKLLLSLGADVNVDDGSGFTPLMEAAK